MVYCIYLDIHILSPIVYAVSKQPVLCHAQTRAQYFVTLCEVLHMLYILHMLYTYTLTHNSHCVSNVWLSNN